MNEQPQRFSIHRTGPAAPPDCLMCRMKQALIELYESRAKRGLDIFTGEPHAEENDDGE